MPRHQIDRIQKQLLRNKLRRLNFDPKLKIDYGTYNSYQIEKGCRYTLDPSKALKFIIPKIPPNCELKPYVSTEILQHAGMLELVMDDLDNSVDRNKNFRKIRYGKQLVDMFEKK